MIVVRNIAGVVVGIVLGMLIVGMADAIALAAFPAPADYIDHMKKQDTKWLQENADRLPTGAGAVMVVGWGLAALVASVAAGAIGGSHKLLCAMIAGDLILAATVLNLALLPHPSWMWPAGIMAIATVLGMSLVGGFLAFGWRLK